MESEQAGKLISKAFTTGLTAEEAFDLELQAVVDDGVADELAQAERDDRNAAALAQSLPEPTPWYGSTPLAMAASALLAVAATLLLVPNERTQGAIGGIASTSVFHLETTRGAPASDLRTVTMDASRQWVTLIVYPSFDDVTEFRIDVDRRAGSAANVDSGQAQWQSIWEGSAAPGNQNSLAVTLSRDVLAVPGIYRVRVIGIPSSAGSADTHLQQFRVE